MVVRDTLAEARSALLGCRPDLVILDLALPDGWAGPAISTVLFSAPEPVRVPSQQGAAVRVKTPATHGDLRTSLEGLRPGGK